MNHLLALNHKQNLLLINLGPVLSNYFFNYKLFKKRKLNAYILLSFISFILFEMDLFSGKK